MSCVAPASTLFVPALAGRSADPAFMVAKASRLPPYSGSLLGSDGRSSLTDGGSVSNGNPRFRSYAASGKSFSHIIMALPSSAKDVRCCIDGLDVLQYSTSRINEFL